VTLDGTRFRSYTYAYPHKTAYRRLEPAVPLGPLWANEVREALSLYIHIPFCEQRCGFCNLFTQPMPTDDRIEAYLGTLERQTNAMRRALDEGGAFTFARAAIGGGTPTYLTARQLERVITMLRTMGVSPAIPMSVETSPETALPDRLDVLVTGGADRISIGVQSFVEAEARAVNRPQRAADVHAALAAIRKAGPRTLNIDLMYGLPGQTETTWRSTLEAALAYRPEELYLYPLYVRALTTLGRRVVRGFDTPAVDAPRVALYELGRTILCEAGYEQVSLRMFRRSDAVTLTGPVYCCQDDGMIGLGCGARSYTHALHYSGEWAVGARGVREIIDRWIVRSEEELGVADYGIRLDADEQRRRWLILSLLSDAGLDRDGFRTRFGIDAVDAFPELAELQTRGFAALHDDSLSLTAEGHARADAIGPWLYSTAVRARMAEFELQ
jgi:coproporphyrinogen III oxidase-like Fe-S oxidoreductase